MRHRQHGTSATCTWTNGRASAQTPFRLREQRLSRRFPAKSASGTRPRDGGAPVPRGQPDAPVPTITRRPAHASAAPRQPLQAHITSSGGTAHIPKHGSVFDSTRRHPTTHVEARLGAMLSRLGVAAFVVSVVSVRLVAAQQPVWAQCAFSLSVLLCEGTLNGFRL